MERTLLLVDDEENILRALSRLFREDGYRILTATSGQAGLDLLQNNQVDVIVSDQRMPGMTGVLFLTTVRDLYPDTVRIILSAYTDFNSVIDAINSGAIYKFFAKPWDDDAMVENIKDAFEQAAEIRSRKENSARLEYQSSRDTLTGLANRTRFIEQLKDALIVTDREQSMLGVMVLDLDRFKNLNESLGHGAGDHLLQKIAQRVVTCIGDEVNVARISGDEFSVLVPALSHSNELENTARMIVDTLREPFEVDEKEIYVTGSIGVSLYPKDGSEHETLLQNAGIAMNVAKAQGGDRYVLFDPKMQANVASSFDMESMLRGALDRQEYLLHFQPQIDIARGRIAGMEVLIRWLHPDMGLVSPVDFIPLLEKTGLIVPVGDWLLYQACRQNKEWQDAGLPKARIAVNVSARQFQEKNLVAVVKRVLRDTGLDPEWLELEITESAIVEDIELTISTMKELKQIGVALAVDDFGTGYSSLSYLKQFPVDTLKIDRAFVQDVMTSEKDRELVASIANMAKGLGLQVVAEGVEDKEQLMFMHGQSCDYVQGYYFSRPLPVKEMTTLLRDGIEIEEDSLTVQARG